jgi:AraC-like DNA-binding protein
MPVQYIDFALHKGKHAYYRHPSHFHPEHYELVYVDYGALKLTEENRSFVLGVGEGYIIPPFVQHSFAAQEYRPFDFLNVGYRGLDIGVLDRQVIRFAEGEREILQMIKRESEGHDSVSLRLLFLKLNEFMLTLQRRLSSNPEPIHPSVAFENTHRYQEKVAQKTLEYLKENYTAPLDPEQVACEVGVSYSYLRQILRNVTHKSLREHLRATRLAAAERMMRSSPDTVKEIAYRCGYRSYPHFCTVFRRHYDMTPREYINSLGEPFRHQAVPPALARLGVKPH